MTKTRQITFSSIEGLVKMSSITETMSYYTNTEKAIVLYLQGFENFSKTIYKYVSKNNSI